MSLWKWIRWGIVLGCVCGPSRVQAASPAGTESQRAQTDVYSGTLDYHSHPYADYPVFIESGSTVELKVDCGTPNTLDPVVQLIHPNGEYIAADDDSGDGPCAGSFRGSRLVFTASDGGTYTVRVTSFWYATGEENPAAYGPYTLTVNGDYHTFPGCDQLPMPASTVGGRMLSDMAVSWMPGQLVDPPVVLTAGTAVKVLGLDETRTYYQIAFACDFLWVPIGSVGPNMDPVWNGAPLPTEIIPSGK